MNPFFTIITPTICRDSLERCCMSVDWQEMNLWEHIIMIDRLSIPATIPKHPWRKVYQCPEEHHDFGNTCRATAWLSARGQYVIYLDDDNYFGDACVLEDIKKELAKVDYPDVAIFPIFASGMVFYNEPPRKEFTDTANFVLKREIAAWPVGPDYAMDGIFIERLVANYGYRGFRHVRPIIVKPTQGLGR